MIGIAKLKKHTRASFNTWIFFTEKVLRTYDQTHITSACIKDQGNLPIRPIVATKEQNARIGNGGTIQLRA